MDEETKELIIKAGGATPGSLRVCFELLTSDSLTGRMALEAAIEGHHRRRIVDALQGCA